MYNNQFEQQRSYLFDEGNIQYVEKDLLADQGQIQIYLAEDVESHDEYLLKVIDIANQTEQEFFKNEITCLRAIAKQRAKNKQIIAGYDETQVLKQLKLSKKGGSENNNSQNEHTKENNFSQNQQGGRQRMKHTRNQSWNSDWYAGNNSSQNKPAATAATLNECTYEQYCACKLLESQSRYLPQLVRELVGRKLSSRILVLNKESFGITLAAFLDQSKVISSACLLTPRRILHYFLQMVNAKAFMHALHIYALFTNLDSFVYSSDLDGFVLHDFQNTTANLDQIQEYLNSFDNKKPQSSHNLNDGDKYPQNKVFFSPQQRNNIRFYPEANEVYAMGGILHFMLFGSEPQPGNRDFQNKMMISVNIKHILQAMLNPEEKLRPSLVVVAKILEKELSPSYPSYSQLQSCFPSSADSKELTKILPYKRLSIQILNNRNSASYAQDKYHHHQQQWKSWDVPTASIAQGYYDNPYVHNRNMQEQPFSNSGLPLPEQQITARQEYKFNQPNEQMDISSTPIILNNGQENHRVGYHNSNNNNNNRNNNINNDSKILRAAEQLPSWMQGVSDTAAAAAGLDLTRYNESVSDTVISFAKHIEVIERLAEQHQKLLQFQNEFPLQSPFGQHSQQDNYSQTATTSAGAQSQSSLRSTFKKLKFMQFYLNKLQQFLAQTVISYILLKEQSIIDDSSNFLLQSIKQAAEKYKSEISPQLTFEVLRKITKKLAVQQVTVVQNINYLIAQTDHPDLDLSYFNVITQNNNNSNNNTIINSNNNNYDNATTNGLNYNDSFVQPANSAGLASNRPSNNTTYPNTQQRQPQQQQQQQSQPPSFPFFYNPNNERSSLGTNGNRSTLGTTATERSSVFGAGAEQASRLYNFNTRNPNSILAEFIKHSHPAFSMGSGKEFNSFLVSLYGFGKYFEKDSGSADSQLNKIFQDIYSRTRELFFEKSQSDGSMIVLRSNIMEQQRSYVKQ